MDEILKREVARWLRYATEDLEEATRLVHLPGTVPRHPAWLAQQAAEKALKAILVRDQVPFPRTHNLTALMKRITGVWKVKSVALDLDRLTEYAVESRYPADMPDITLQEALLAVEEATRLVKAVQEDLDKQLR